MWSWWSDSQSSSGDEVHVFMSSDSEIEDTENTSVKCAWVCSKQNYNSPCFPHHRNHRALYYYCAYSKEICNKSLLPVCSSSCKAAHPCSWTSSLSLNDLMASRTKVNTSTSSSSRTCITISSGPQKQKNKKKNSFTSGKQENAPQAKWHMLI